MISEQVNNRDCFLPKKALLLIDFGFTPNESYLAICYLTHSFSYKFVLYRRTEDKWTF